MMRLSQEPLWTGAMSCYPYSESLQKFCNRQSRFSEPVSLGVVRGGHIYVPRNIPLELGEDRRTSGADLDIERTVPPRNEEQARVIKESVYLLKHGTSHVIRATTGFGKTYCGVSIAAEVKKPTLIVVTKEDLMGETQWGGAIKNFTDTKPEEIGLIQGDVCDYKGKKFVLGMVQSLMKDKYGDEIKSAFGLVVFDEVHRMAADQFSIVCGMFDAKLRLGLSATPDRIDGKEFVFQAHIGPELVCSQLQTMTPKVIFRKTTFKPPHWMKVEPARMMAVYKAMAQDPERNKIILESVYSGWKRGRRIIVFSDLKDAHLEPLMYSAMKMGIPKEDMALYVGGLSEHEREVAKQKKVMWATYAMAAEATDVPALDMAVFATPRANVVQPVGRIRREHPNKKQPVVIDLVDSRIPLLEGFMSKRRKDYYAMGASMMWL